MTLTSDNVQTLTRQAWTSVLGEDIDCGVAPTSTEPVHVTSCVHVTGEWNGAIVLQCSRLLARSVTESMFEMSPGEASAAEIEDAVGELANIIGGGLKCLLPGPSTLSLPTVTDGVAMAIPGSEAILGETFSAGGEAFIVTVHQRAAATTSPDADSTHMEGVQR